MKSHGVSSRRWSGPAGTGKSAALKALVTDVIDRGLRPIAYLPAITDVGLRTERVSLPDPAIAAALGADAFEGRLTRHLSSGERQRVRLAGALSGCTRFAALDEPCRHLDPDHLRALNEVLTQRAEDGLEIAVSDARRMLAPELFAWEVGGEAAPAPVPKAAGPVRGDPLQLAIPDPFLLSCPKRKSARLTVSVDRGALIVVRGPNGGGKTSLIEALARAASERKLRVGISRQEPEHQVFASTPARELRDIGAAHPGTPWCLDDDAWAGSSACQRLLSTLALQPWLSHPTPRLPPGVLNLLGAAIALWMGHDLVLLDEPTQGLDIPSARSLAGELVRAAASGARILVASHDPELLRIANRTWTVAGGMLDRGDGI